MEHGQGSPNTVEEWGLGVSGEAREKKRAFTQGKWEIKKRQ